MLLAFAADYHTRCNNQRPRLWKRYVSYHPPCLSQSSFKCLAYLSSCTLAQLSVTTGGQIRHRSSCVPEHIIAYHCTYPIRRLTLDLLQRQSAKSMKCDSLHTAFRVVVADYCNNELKVHIRVYMCTFCHASTDAVCLCECFSCALARPGSCRICRLSFECFSCALARPGSCRICRLSFAHMCW